MLLSWPGPACPARLSGTSGEVQPTESLAHLQLDAGGLCCHPSAVVARILSNELCWQEDPGHARGEGCEEHLPPGLGCHPRVTHLVSGEASQGHWPWGEPGCEALGWGPPEGDREAG